MKILRLNLIAYGPFSDAAIDLDPVGLHIVYGPNEAGKSTMLRALRQVLYGIDTRTNDNFIHPYQNLRIGATLSGNGGRTLEFVRRKGLSKTLRDHLDAQPLDDGVLTPFLGGVDESVFVSMFGIDHESLVKGGEEIIQGGGEIGKTLFSAASGITDLQKTQMAFQKEADDLFKPSAQKPAINAMISALKDKQKAMRDAELSSQEWETHHQCLKEALARKTRIENELIEKHKAKNRLERIEEALPLISKLKDLNKEYEPLKNAPMLPLEFGKTRIDLLTDLKVAESAKSRAAANIEELVKSMAVIEIPRQIVEQKDMIEQAHQELFSFRKNRILRGKLEGQLGIVESEIEDLRKWMPEKMDIGMAERLIRTQAGRLRELAREYDKLMTRSENTHEEIRRLSHRHEDLKTRLAEIEAPKDISRLHHALNSALEEGQLEKQYQALAAENHQSEQAVIAALKKQSIWKGGLDDIIELPLPPLETTDMFERRFNDADTRISKLHESIDELETRLIDIDGHIKQLKLEQNIPTEDDLIKARRRREEGWRLVLRAWQGGGLAAEHYISMFPEADNLAKAYEISVFQADDISDRLRREADRVAGMAKFMAERQVQTSKRDRLKEKLAQTDTERTALDTEWKNLWQSVDIIPKSPREMRIWTQNIKMISDQTTTLKLKRVQAEKIAGRITHHRRELMQYLSISSASEPSLSEIIAIAQQVIKKAEALRFEKEKLESEFDHNSKELEDTRKRSQNIQEQYQNWETRWKSLIQTLAFDISVKPPEMIQITDDLRKLFDKLKEAEKLRLQIKTIDDEAGEYRSKVNELARTVAPDIADMPIEQRVTELNNRLNNTKMEKKEEEEITKQLRKEEEIIRKAQVRIEEIEASLKTMCKEAGCETHDQLPEAEDRSANKRRIQAEKKELEIQLHRLSGGISLGDFLHEAEKIDPDAIVPNIDRFGEDIEALNKTKSEVDQIIGSENAELARMDGRAAAAEIAEDIQDILGNLHNTVEKFARIRIAETILNQAIERYREKHQDPILKSSSDIFSRITVGSFEGLRLDFSEKGDAVLVGLRPGSPNGVHVEGMSDGAADQLYLSVRLAGLKAYLKNNEPMPFIVDDILIKFDDDRAAATLEILSEIAQTTQIIFFTHHRHLVDLAQKHLQPKTFIIHRL